MSNFYIPGGCTACNDSLVGDEPAGATLCSRCHDYDADDANEEESRNEKP